MECCTNVEKENNSVYIKLNEQKELAESVIDESIEKLNLLLNGIKNDESIQLTESRSAEIKNTFDILKKKVFLLGSAHKNLHSTVSKVGKAIDRSFESEFVTLLSDSKFDKHGNTEDLNVLICDHLLRNGSTDIVSTLHSEANITNKNELHNENLMKIYKIRESLKSHDLKSALQWTIDNRVELDKMGSSLGFLLHRMHYVELLKSSQNETDKMVCRTNRLRLIERSRDMASYAIGRQKDLMHLMGAIIFCHSGIQDSPYFDLVNQSLETQWLELSSVFTRDSCNLLSIPIDSPLSIVIDTGCSAIQPLLNIKQVMEKRQCSEVWSNKDELPVEIDLADDVHYHSVFACPILRQQATLTNPPVRLVCGHAISKDALTKLAGTNQKRRINSSNKDKPISVKCPYCPIEQTISDVKYIHF